MSSYEGIAYDFRKGNQDVAEATKRFNGRIFGYVVVNPRFREQAAEEVRKYVRVHDFRGIKLTIRVQGIQMFTEFSRKQ